MTSIVEIEKSFESYLQSEIKFLCEGKTVKSGKLQFFCIKDFFCVFTLIDDTRLNKKFVYEIPYPFNYFVKPDHLVFDYSLDSFCNKDINLHSIIGTLKIKKPSKFFNKRILVTPIDYEVQAPIIEECPN